MEERKTIDLKKEEFSIREFVKKSLGKGKVSRVTIEYTPVGEKIVLSTSKPGLVIGRGGENIDKITQGLKKQFNLENPHVEIDEVKVPEFDAHIIADEIATGLENLGPLKFKVIAYKTLQKIMNKGALGAEIRISGKVPGARSKSWRFSQGYLKKAGDTSKIVDYALAIAQTKPGTVGIKVSILGPDVELVDKIEVNEELINKLKENRERLDTVDKVAKEVKKSAKRTKKSKTKSRKLNK